MRVYEPEIATSSRHTVGLVSPRSEDERRRSLEVRAEFLQPKSSTEYCDAAYDVEIAMQFHSYAMPVGE